MRDELLRGGSAPRTVVRHLTVAHGVFKHAVRAHGLARNPAAAELVDRPTVQYNGEFRSLDVTQLQALVRAMDPVYAPLVLTAAFTGLRQAELVALSWSQIDWTMQCIRVTRAYSIVAKQDKSPKSGRVRSVPLVPDLVPVLDGLSRRGHTTAPEDLVFLDELGRRVHHATLRRRFYEGLEEAGLPRTRFHDLRHVFGSTAVKAFPLSDVQAMLGHAHITTTMRYVHHQPKVEDAARLSAAFAGTTVSPFVSRDMSRNPVSGHVS